MSDAGVPIERISQLVGHSSGTSVTEAVYRKQIRPVITEGAEVMDRIFPRDSQKGEKRPRMLSYPVGYATTKAASPFPAARPLAATASRGDRI